MNPAEQIRALRRLADSTTYPAEAETARVKARELQEKYAVPEEALQPPSVPDAPPAAPPPGWNVVVSTADVVYHRSPFLPVVVVWVRYGGASTGASGWSWTQANTV